MSLINDIYDAGDQAMNAHEEKKRKESMAKAVAKKKAEQAAKQQSDSGSFL